MHHANSLLGSFCVVLKFVEKGIFFFLNSTAYNFFEKKKNYSDSCLSYLWRRSSCAFLIYQNAPGCFRDLCELADYIGNRLKQGGTQCPTVRPLAWESAVSLQVTSWFWRKSNRRPHWSLPSLLPLERATDYFCWLINFWDRGYLCLDGPLKVNFFFF